MQETRHAFREALKDLERQTLGGMDLVLQQLDRALEAVSYQDVELAGMVVADDDRIDGRYLEVHQGILSLLARQAPVAGDLRIVAALLHTIRCIERMGDQCVNIAKLVPLSGHEAPKDKDLLDAIERMGQLAHSQVSQAKDAFAASRQNLVTPPQHAAGSKAVVTTVPGLGNEAFSAQQVFKVGGAVTDVATVVVRYHNVIVTATLNGLDHSNKGKYGPVSPAQLAAAALTFAKAAAGALPTS